MRTTGVVRRIDELGRVVIPKEIRRTMRLKVGEEMEIYTENDLLVLKKFSTIGQLKEYAENYAQTLAEVSGCTVVVCDNDSVIAASGENKRQLLDKQLSKNAERVIAERTLRTLNGENTVNLAGEEFLSRQQIFAPVINHGDIIGAVVLLSSDGENTAVNLKLAEAASDFLGKLL